jgi:hypothetical protein
VITLSVAFMVLKKKRQMIVPKGICAADVTNS